MVKRRALKVSHFGRSYSCAIVFCICWKEKLHWNLRQKGFVTTCFEKRCLKLWKACMEFLLCIHIQKSVKQTPWLQGRHRSLPMQQGTSCAAWREQSRSTWETPAAHRENLSSLQTTFNYPSDRVEQHRVAFMWGKTRLQKNWPLISVTQVLTPSLRTSHPAFKDSYQPKEDVNNDFKITVMDPSTHQLLSQPHSKAAVWLSA